MPKTKVEVYDKNQLIYPFIESDHVTFSNGMKVTEMLDQSISMPTVTHEDLSFKVGIGDQDVSSAIVDSSVSEMTIKGKTYQNILPEPSTHVLTNNKEMFKVNEGLDPNVEIVDGVSKSAILKGQTLVNLSGQLTHHEKWVEIGDDLVLNLPSGNGQPHIHVGLLYKLKKDTIYTVVINMKSYETGYPHICFMDESNKQLASDREWTPSTTGVLKTKFTTSSTVEAAILRIIPRNGMDNIYTINKNIIILEGDYTNVDIPYFTGMQSVKMPVLHTVGKNLIPLKEDWVQGQIMNGGGISVNSYALRTKSKIKVKPNTKYTFSTKSSDCKIAYHEWEANGKYIKDSGWITAFPYTFTTNNKTEYINLTTRRVSNVNSTVDNLDDTLIWQLEESSTATSYEPYKSNILSTPEEVVLKGIGNIKDTLNLNTGEYVQRIGEIVLDGTNIKLNNTTSEFNNDNFYSIYCYPSNRQPILDIVSDKLITTNSRAVLLSTPSIYIFDKNTGQVVISFERSKLSESSINGVKEFLQQNPLTIQYQFATPIIKTVDLSSSGNWEKVVLDGSEEYNCDLNEANRIQIYIPRTSTTYKMYNSLPVGEGGSSFYHCNNNKSFMSCAVGNTYAFVLKIDKTLFDEDLSSSEMKKNINVIKGWLSQNPITVWYQTQTHQDSTQVKQPIFFKDGHIQLSSGADNSLIPTLDYQAKTSNSYVMDLMKANTRYTMKAKTANGTFTIDGTSYGAGTNGTFTAPSSMTNKLLVMSNKTNEKVMILEGDLTSKTIPYFKGIKSAFEDESKIEVLSTGKNLLDPSKFCGDERWLTLNNDQTISISQTANGAWYCLYKDLKIPTNTYITLEVLEGTYEGGNVGLFRNGELLKELWWGDGGKKVHTYNQVYDELKIWSIRGNCKVRISITETEADYESYKSNSTKIPLLSPLRSLPNGVCDEIILDRESNKAALIQRVGYSVINSEFAKNGGDWGNTKDTDPCWGFHCGNYVQGSFKLNEHNSINDKLPIKGMATTGDPLMGYYQSNPHIAVRRVEACNLTMAKEWLDRNPINFYYQLATPVVIEVDLEGFPYIYKDGHIFLNSEITPTTEIIYSINQRQQISASNEDIIRHEKELTYLQKLIAQYVQIDYESVLLSLKV